jgi:glutamate racemase
VTGHVLVTGTEGTVRGGAYQRALLGRRPDLKVDAVACPLFVSLAEEGWTEGPIAEAVARRYLEIELAGPARTRVDTLVLGCTHFPVLRGVIERMPKVYSRVSRQDQARCGSSRPTHPSASPGSAGYFSGPRSRLPTWSWSTCDTVAAASKKPT